MKDDNDDEKDEKKRSKRNRNTTTKITTKTTARETEMKKKDEDERKKPRKEEGLKRPSLACVWRGSALMYTLFRVFFSSSLSTSFLLFPPSHHPSYSPIPPSSHTQPSCQHLQRPHTFLPMHLHPQSCTHSRYTSNLAGSRHQHFPHT